MADVAGYVLCGDVETVFANTGEDKRHLVELTLKPGFLLARSTLGVGVLR
jgi:hypothetical protein